MDIIFSNTVFNIEVHCYTHGFFDLSLGPKSAIVNPANERCLGGGGLDGMIHQKAGLELMKACEDLPSSDSGRRCPTGEARITKSFGILTVGYIIHTVAPVKGIDPIQKGLKILEGTYLSVYEKANNNEISDIILSGLGSGAYGWSGEETAGAAYSALEIFSKKHDWRTRFLKKVHLIDINQAVINGFLRLFK